LDGGFGNHRTVSTALTYLDVHALFVVPAVAALAVATVARRRAVDCRLGAAGLVVLTALAVGYTVPWDSHLVARGVWSYGTGRVAGWLFGVPVGEFLFFVLQPALTTLWTLRVDGPVLSGVRHSRRDRALGAVAVLTLPHVAVVTALDRAAGYW
jgi:lycopene cyclase domain-containing protein